MGCGEEEVSAGGCFDRLVAVELSAVVDSDGPDAPSGVVDEFDGTAVGGLDGSSGELADDSEAGPTVDEKWLRAVGAAVRSRRLELGLCQEALGYKAKLDRTYISGVERGVRNPTVGSLRRIAEALDVEPSFLLAAAESAQL